MTEAINVQFRLQWVGDLVSPPSPINQAMLMADVPAGGTTKPEAHILALGFVSPPMLHPEMDPAEVEALAAQPIPVLPSGRFILTTSRLRELRDQIDQHLANIDSL